MRRVKDSKMRWLRFHRVIAQGRAAAAAHSLETMFRITAQKAYQSNDGYKKPWCPISASPSPSLPHPHAQTLTLAGEAERASWVGSPQHSTVFIGSDLLHLDGNRTIVLEGATDLKTELLTLAHTSLNHYTGAERTLWTLREQCRITWKGISDDVSDFVRRCVRCAMAKPRRHGKSNEGLLHPTLAPYVHHMWYADLKGPLPHDTGYILAIRESISRVVKLRQRDGGHRGARRGGDQLRHAPGGPPHGRRAALQLGGLRGPLRGQLRQSRRRGSLPFARPGENRDPIPVPLGRHRRHAGAQGSA